jgi:hypothetical protein
MITLDEFKKAHEAELAVKYFALENPADKNTFTNNEFEEYRKTNLLKLINANDDVNEVIPEVAKCDIDLNTIQSVTRDYVTFKATIGGKVTAAVRVTLEGFCELTGDKNNEQ